MRSPGSPCRSRYDKHLIPLPHGTFVFQVLPLIVEAMREAPGGPWLKSKRIVEQMEKDGFRFRASDLNTQRMFLRSVIKGEGAGIFAVTGTKNATKYALVEVVGEQPEASLTEGKVEKGRMDRRATAEVMC